MCLMITLLAAIIATILWYARLPDNQWKLGTLSLIYWGAVLMWLVDGFFALGEGEPFLNLSGDDAVLGLIVVICGLAIWLFTVLWSDPKKALWSFKAKDE